MAGKNKKTALPNILVQSKLKEYIAAQGLRTGGDAIDALNEAVLRLVDDAVKRCTENSRATVGARDI